MIGLSNDEINEIKDICTALLQELKNEIDSEKEKLFEEAKIFTAEDIKKMEKEMETYSHKHSKNINASKRRK